MRSFSSTSRVSAWRTPCPDTPPGIEVVEVLARGAMEVGDGEGGWDDGNGMIEGGWDDGKGGMEGGM